jgi:uncharacterized protein YjbI with pentapeptide repeats
MSTSTRTAILTTLALALAPLALAFSACTTSGFECGSPLASDPKLTYTCARPEEVCICATRSCARPEYPTADQRADDAELAPGTRESDRIVCPSGLRYVPEIDFVVDDDLAGKCVATAHAPADQPELVLNQRDSQSRCPGTPPVPEASATEATTDTTDITTTDMSTTDMSTTDMTTTDMSTTNMSTTDMTTGSTSM